MLIQDYKKYLTLPVNTHASLKKLKFYKPGESKLLFDLDVRLDTIAPNFTAYIDTSIFNGCELEVKCDPEMEFSVGTTDIFAPDAENEPYRPKIHFALKNGWNNDPNGLIKYDGLYHLFYQYNPCCSDWGNMHWGHAVSKDLIKWEELDIALFPDEHGTMYSGCAFEDKKRVSGLGDTTSKSAPVLLYYTAAANNLLSAGKKFTQCLAVMQDGKIEKYKNNPIIPHIEGGNRDPKVVWVEELGKYLLALYLTEKRFMFFVSDDLINWSEFQTLALTPDRECPDIYSLECDGEKLWVLSGASDYYTVGRFVNGKFETVGSLKRLSLGGMNYAAQSFSGTEDGRAIRIYWQRCGIPSATVTQQMSIPVEMSLTKENGEYYLSALPVREIEAYRHEVASISELGSNPEIKIPLSKAPLDIVFKAAKTNGAKIKMRIFGNVVTLDTANNVIIVGKNKTPLSFLSKKNADVRMVVDRCSIEIFSDEGKILFAAPFVCDYNLPYVSVTSDKAIKTDEFKIYEI